MTVVVMSRKLPESDNNVNKLLWLIKKNIEVDHIRLIISKKESRSYTQKLKKPIEVDHILLIISKTEI